MLKRGLKYSTPKGCNMYVYMTKPLADAKVITKEVAKAIPKDEERLEDTPIKGQRPKN
jgi:hypothetical protein